MQFRASLTDHANDHARQGKNLHTDTQYEQAKRHPSCRQLDRIATSKQEAYKPQYDAYIDQGDNKEIGPRLSGTEEPGSKYDTQEDCRQGPLL